MAKIDVGPPLRRPNPLGPGHQMCVWTNFPARPDHEYYATVITPTRGGAASEPLTASAPIDGIPAEAYLPPTMNDATHCGYVLNVNPDQNWWIQYGSINALPSPTSHRAACDKARTLAGDMVRTWRARGGMTH